MRKLKVFFSITSLTVCCVSFVWHLQNEKKIVATDSETKPTDDIDRRPLVNNRSVITDLTLAISDVEYKFLSVDLPSPVDGDWEGNFFNSKNMFSEGYIDGALDVLPIWIRKAIRNGRRDLAARYLYSLILLVDHDDLNISSAATINLYRLGDYKNSLLENAVLDS